MDGLGRFNLLTLLILSVIVVAFVACGSETPPEDDAPSGETGRAAPESPATEATPADDAPTAESAPAEATTQGLGEFASVSAGDRHTCAVRADSSVACWGSNYGTYVSGLGRGVARQAQPPIGQFASVSAAQVHTCGVRMDGTVACWGANSDGAAAPPEGEFLSVSAGFFHTCGVRKNGTVACWGSYVDQEGTFVVLPTGSEGEANVAGLPMPPEGEFTSVSSGIFYSCGVRKSGALACWGISQVIEGFLIEVLAPPEGEFISVSAGAAHACGVRTDGSVACWGANEDQNGNVVGQATPPGGEFASVSAGNFHTCGVRSDGTVACWGANEDENGNIVGQAAPPEGKFASVSTGAWHTCGVSSDGIVVCWGSNLDTDGTFAGQTDPDRIYEGREGVGVSRADATPTTEASAEQTPTATPVVEARDASRTSWDNYLAICAQADFVSTASSEGPLTLERVAAELREVITLFESVEPPEEFADWHDSTTSFLRAGVEALDDAPEPGEGASEAQVEQYIISVLSPAAFEHGPKITEILNGMDRDAITAMIEADCIDEEVLEGR